MTRLLPLLLLLLPGVALADPISGLTAIGSAFAGTAAAGITLVQGLTVAGSALGLVGLVTGNKKLAKLGGILGLAGGITSLLKSGMEAAAQAGTAQLSQTVTPVEQIAQEATAAASAAPSAADAVSQAQAAGLGTEDLVASAAKASEVVDATPSPVRDALRKIEVSTAPAGKDASLLGRLAEGIKSNKELVQLGAGLVSGAAQGYQQRALRKDEEAAIRRQQQRYSDSVKGVQPIGQFINSGADVTNVPTRDPMRYVPRRGLVSGRTPGG